MKVDVIKLDASKAGQIELSDAVFGIEHLGFAGDQPM